MAVTEDLEIVCTYTPYITILSSVEKDTDGKLSLALAEGAFTDKAELHINRSEAQPPKNVAGNVRVFDIELENTDIAENDPVTIRVLNADHSTVTAWRLNNNKWEKTKVRSRGKYIVLDTMGANSTICLNYTKKEPGFIWVIIAAFILSGSAALIIIKRKVNKIN